MLLGCGATVLLAAALTLAVLSLGRRPAASATATSAQERLVAAVRGEDLAAIEALLAGGADPDAGFDGNGWSPLLHAVHLRRHRAARELLAAGADPDTPGDEGQRPLLMAAAYGDEQMVELLLAAGADPHLGGQGWANALEAALTGAADLDGFTFSQCQPGTVRILLDHAPGLRPQGPAGRLGGVFAYLRGCDEVERLLEGGRRPTPDG